MQAVSRRPHPSAGWTLIELMVVLVVMALLLGVGVPAFARLIEEQRVIIASTDLHGAMFLARSQAIHRNRRVTICTSSDGVQCHPALGWHGGWMVFEDVNANAVADFGETVVLVRQSAAASVHITGNAPVRDYVSYTPIGAARMKSGALQMGTITLCAGESGRQIVINAAGRPRVVRQHQC